MGGGPHPHPQDDQNNNNHGHDDNVKVVLIHNSTAKEALKITTTHALPFDLVGQKVKKKKDKEEGKKNGKETKGQKEPADDAEQKKKPEKKKDKKEPKKVKKEKTPAPTSTLKPLELRGSPELVPAQRDALAKSMLGKVEVAALQEAALLFCKSAHPLTVGGVLESLVVCLMETDTKTRTAGGQLLDMLLIREAIGPDLVKKWALEKLVETAVDMIEVIIPIIFISKILIFHNQGHSQLLGLAGRDLLSWLHQRRSSALCCQRFRQSPSLRYNGRRIGFCNIL